MLTTSNVNFALEVAEGKRFEFGKNWERFLATLNDDRIALAEQSLKQKLGVKDLQGIRFLDIGSGSGLFSLAARRLGASVHSFDYDPQSVACTAELKRRFFPEDTTWTIEEGSVLNDKYLASLGVFDVVYSWGVLHHTGNMWQALENAYLKLAPEGTLFISIYNDQGKTSKRWTAIKRIYNRSPRPFKLLVLWYVFILQWGKIIIRDTLRAKPLYSWRNYDRERGMSAWRDVVDWVGGYPFEVAKPEEIFEFYAKKGLRLQTLKTCGGGHGCNEFVFVCE